MDEVGPTSSSDYVHTQPIDKGSQMQLQTSNFELKMLRQDKDGYYIDIPKSVSVEIDEHQSFFTPIFLKALENFADAEEFSDLDPTNPFCFSPKTIEIIRKKVVLPTVKELESVLGGIIIGKGKELSWKEAHVDGLLGKLLAFESFRINRIMATRAREYMLKVYPDEEEVRVLEYCAGAGITTALLYNSLARTSKNIKFYTVDNSLQSVACAMGFLTAVGIPTRVILERDEDQVNSDFSGVKIYFDTAQNFSKENFANKFHLIVSDSGLNYLPEHDKILNSTENVLDRSGLIQICTIDPATEIDLSIIKMLSTIAFGKHSEIYRRHKSNIYELSEVTRKQENGEQKNVTIIKQMYSASTSLQYHILQKLFRIDRELFWDYLNGAKSAAAITKILSPKIKIDLRKSGETLLLLYPNAKLSYIPSYSDQETSLTRFLDLENCPVG